MELTPGTTVDRFLVEALVGRGGMASVYRIRHKQLQVAYALKVMHVTHPEFADRIRSEGMLQAELRHPNIVSVFDLVDIGGLPSLVMEYVDGPSLAGLLAVHKPTLEQIDSIARGIMRGVRTAHGQGLIHRDLKPANVLMAHTDEGYLPKITDFGLAKNVDTNANMTKTGAVMGTPAYMAPEQFRNTRGVDARADVYSLGVMLYELVAKRRPYEADDLFELLDRVRKADYPRITEVAPKVPDRMADAIEGAMLVDIEARIPSVDKLYQVWCGEARSDRSTIWDRKTLKRIGARLSDDEDDDSDDQAAPEPDPIAAAGTRLVPDLVAPQQVPVAPEPVAVARPVVAPPPEPDEPSEEAEPVNDDATRFEPIVRTPTGDEDRQVAQDVAVAGPSGSQPLDRSVIAANSLSSVAHQRLSNAKTVERPIEGPGPPAPARPPLPPNLQSVVPKAGPNLLDSTPSLHLPPSLTSFPAAAPASRLLPWLGMLLLIGVGALGAGGALLLAGTVAMLLQPADERALPPIVRPEMPEIVEPAPVPEPVPDPVPEAIPEPVPVEPAPRPRPQPRVSKGRVKLTGDALRIELAGSNGTFGAGSVPEGSYKLTAHFEQQGRVAQKGEVVVTSERDVAIHCVKGFFSCTVK